MEAFTILFNDNHGALVRSGILFNRLEDPNSKSRIRVGSECLLVHRRLVGTAADRYYETERKLMMLEPYLDSVDKNTSFLYGTNKKLWRPQMKFFRASIRKTDVSCFLVCPYPDDKRNLLLSLMGIAGNNTETEVFYDQSTLVMTEIFSNRNRNAISREALLVLNPDTVNNVVYKIYDKILKSTRYFELTWDGRLLNLYERAYATSHSDVVRNREMYIGSYKIKQMNSRDYYKMKQYHKELDILYDKYYD